MWKRVGFANLGVSPAIYRQVAAVREIEALKLGIPDFEIILLWVAPLGITLALRARKD